MTNVSGNELYINCTMHVCEIALILYSILHIFLRVDCAIQYTE